MHWLELKTDDCVTRLGRGELDAAITADPTALPSVDDIEVGWELFWAVVPEAHALTGSVDVATFAALEVLLLEDGRCLRDHTMASCMKPGSREAVYNATSLPTLVQMVGSGLGVSVCRPARWVSRCRGLPSGRCLSLVTASVVPCGSPGDHVAH